MENYKSYKDYFIKHYCYDINNKINYLTTLNKADLKKEEVYQNFDNWQANEYLTTRQFELFKSKEFKKLHLLLDKQLLKEKEKLKNKKIEALEEYNKIKDLKDIKSIVIHVDWSTTRKSMLAYQTKAMGYIFFENGDFKEYETTWTGGCGYDKASTSLSVFCNNTLKILLLKHFKKIIVNENRQFYACENLYFSYGVGVSSYERMFKAMGYNVKYIPRGKNNENFSLFITKRGVKNVL